jgi:DNA-directed RNA polymerase subunit M/transcription elongation factor TFIIS
MQGYGPASESLRLAEHYRQMADGELISLSENPSELTEMAKDALSQEISSRRLRIPPPKAPAFPKPPPDRPEEGSTYEEERELVVVAKVYSLRDALQVQRILDVAGIPFYMGPEKATGVDAVTSNYAQGVEVKVMQIGVPWAFSALTRSYEPKDEPAEEQVDWDDTVAVRCPRCRSEAVIFERLSQGAAPGGAGFRRFQWTCGACGHAWENDGIAK